MAALEQLDELVTCLELASKRMAQAAEQLEAIPRAVSGALGKAFPPGCGQGGALAALPCLAEKLGAWGAQCQAGAGHIANMSDQLQAMRAQSEVARRLVSDRNSALGNKSRTDREAEALRRRFGRSYSLEEKRDRLHAKATADKVLQVTSARAVEALDKVLAETWPSTAGVLSELCRCICTVLGEAQPLADDLDSLARCLAESSLAADGEAAPVLLGSTVRLDGAQPKSAWDPLQSSTCPLTLCSEEARPVVSLVAAAALQQPAQSVGQSPSALSAPTTSPPPGGAGLAGSPRRASCMEGERVEIWSSGEGAWLLGLVERVFSEEAVDVVGEGSRFKVPAGSIKVSHAKGFKYVRTEQVQMLLRSCVG